MTIIGKILTLLVFFLSVLFLGFAIAINRLNKDPVTKKSWFEVAEMRKKEVQSAHQDLVARNDEITALQSRITSLANDVKTVTEARVREVNQQRERADKEAEKAKQVEKKFADAQNAAIAATEELKNRSADVLRLTSDLKDREVAIADLHTKVTQSTNERIQAQVESKSLKDRLATAQKEYEDLVRAQEEARAAVVVTPSGARVTQEVVANPPKEDVEGRILGVASDGGEGLLMEISLGSDDGIERGQTLEIFRLQPKPEYLGRMRIEEVRAERAVGKLVDQKFKKQIRIKDQVASRILTTAK